MLAGLGQSSMARVVAHKWLFSTSVTFSSMLAQLGLYVSHRPSLQGKKSACTQVLFISPFPNLASFKTSHTDKPKISVGVWALVKGQLQPWFGNISPNILHP